MPPQVGDKSLERFRQEYEKLHRALKKARELRGPCARAGGVGDGSHRTKTAPARSIWGFILPPPNQNHESMISVGVGRIGHSGQDAVEQITVEHHKRPFARSRKPAFPRRRAVSALV